jgi:hypothetical protein
MKNSTEIAFLEHNWMKISIQRGLPTFTMEDIL